MRSPSAHTDAAVARNKGREKRGNYLIGDQNLSLSHAISNTHHHVSCVGSRHYALCSRRRRLTSIGSHQLNDRGDKRSPRHN